VVKAVVPVASGKGGVGKSTVAVNLALGLSRLGLKVCLLDLALYGPSVPLMLGITGAQPSDNGDGRIAPVVAHGLKIMSIGFMVGADKALIWRGPILMKAVKQLLHEVAWEPLDILVLDLPPGTGDVQITMAQEVPVAGAVVVTTPQDVALVDAIKAVDMFNHTGAPVLGIVENMSYFVCPDCGGRHEIFGHGSVAPLSAKLGVPFLGEVPLDAQVRAAMDAGAPIIETDQPAAQAYRDLAAKVLARIRETRPELEV
jgi:ATP-binding protein involved in chromosome partitioning